MMMANFLKYFFEHMIHAPYQPTIFELKIQCCTRKEQKKRQTSLGCRLKKLEYFERVNGQDSTVDFLQKKSVQDCHHNYISVIYTLSPGMSMSKFCFNLLGQQYICSSLCMIIWQIYIA